MTQNPRPISKPISKPSSHARRILFCRLPGLLTRAACQFRDAAHAKDVVQARDAAQAQDAASASPAIVADGKRVRDACPRAVLRGIHTGQTVAQARRLCPSLRVFPLESLAPSRLTTPFFTMPFLDCLADLSPVVEPHGPDAAYADLTGLSDRELASVLGRLSNAFTALTGLSPVLGQGRSRLAARACAECGLPPEQLGDASVEWLWPEDTKVIGRLQRLGLATFGDVAALREEDLFYQFGKIGRLLHRRAQGIDLTTVQPLYPPLRVEAALDFAEFPLQDRTLLQASLAAAAHEAGQQLWHLGRFGRRLVLRITTERDEVRRDWTLPAPLQESHGLTRAASRLLMQMPITAPVTALRLLVEDLETPQATTPDLFAGRMHRDKLALDAARRRLAERYGPQVLIVLGQRPQTIRERRRSAEGEVWN